MPENDLMEKIVSLCKRRGFIFPGSEIYGGLANSWDYGPLGVGLKNNIKNLWWKRFVEQRDDMVGIDAALMMNPKVWSASGHLQHFSDPMVECKKCHSRYRDVDFLEGADTSAGSVTGSQNELIKKGILEKGCKTCGTKKFEDFTPAREFNLMFKTFVGAIDPMEAVGEAVAALDVDSSSSLQSKIKNIRDQISQADRASVYLRPETAQAMFVNFPNILETARMSIPFGIAQIGKAFRNEITPGNFIFRTREFEQMEIEYFIREQDWQKQFDYWLDQMKQWLSDIGIDQAKLHYSEIDAKERAHYSKRTVDIEFEYPFGQKELYGIAYRTDFDLKNHQKFSKQSMEYLDPASGEKFIPHIIEPTFGVDRTVLAVLLSAYSEIAGGRTTTTASIKESEVVLRLDKKIAPIKIAILPLSKKDQLSAPAKQLAASLRRYWVCQYDETGSIGKRYRRQDEIGTPYCLTFDFDSVSDNKVTVRDRDTMKQDRVAIPELPDYFKERLQ